MTRMNLLTKLTRYFLSFPEKRKLTGQIGKVTAKLDKKQKTQENLERRIKCPGASDNEVAICKTKFTDVTSQINGLKKEKESLENALQIIAKDQEIMPQRIKELYQLSKNPDPAGQFFRAQLTVIVSAFMVLFGTTAFLAKKVFQRLNQQNTAIQNA